MFSNKNYDPYADLNDQKVSLAKLMVYLSIGLFLLGTALDYFSAPTLLEEIFLVRITVCTVLSGVLSLIYLKPDIFLKHYNFIISFLFLSSSMTIIYMIYMTNVDDIAHATYFAGLILIIVTVFLGTYIPTTLSVFISFIIISAFLGMSYYLKTDFNLAANNAFFLGAGLIVGILSNALKTNQLSQILLLQKSLKESLRDQHLETKKQALLANTDSITNIPNRRYGTELLEKMISNADGLNMCTVIYFLDLNGFKQINDRYGHNIGDEVLKITASRLLNAGRGSDVFFRQGGDEFIYAIMIERDNLDFIKKFESYMREAIRPLMTVNKLTLGIKTSIGHSISPIDGYSVTDLIRIADKDMYENKAKIKMELEESIPSLEIHKKDQSIVSLSKYRTK